MIQSIDQLNFKIKKQVHPSPDDWRDQFIYFLLVDRFDDNRWHFPYLGFRKKPVLDVKNGLGIHGGNIKGVTRRLRYLKSLGVTTIWLSPIMKNRVDANGSLHGYAIQNFLEVDPHYGTKEDLQNLVSTAHKMGMYIVLDIVINHTGDNWAYENDSKPEFKSDGTKYPFGFWRAKNLQKQLGPDDAVWPAELQDPDCYTRRGTITNWYDPEQAVYGDFFNLKDLNLNYPPTFEALVAIYKYWMAELDIDGYRVDTVKHVENQASVKFFNNIKEYAESIGKHNFLIFGEIVDSDASIAKYVGNQMVKGERIQALDASLDFPLYFILDEVIKGRVSPAQLRNRYDTLHATYTQTDGSNSLVTFIDNHDQVNRQYRRFLFDAEDNRQAILGIGYLLTSTGIPTIYYGTEQGFSGGGTTGDHHDNFIRECMFGGRWGAFGIQHRQYFNKWHTLYKHIAHIATVRSHEPALRYGRLYFREIREDTVDFMYPELGKGMIAYSRILDDTEILVVLNLRPHEYSNYVTLDQTLTPPGTAMQNLLNTTMQFLTTEEAGRTVVSLTLAPYEFVILKKSA